MASDSTAVTIKKWPITLYSPGTPKIRSDPNPNQIGTATTWKNRLIADKNDNARRSSLPRGSDLIGPFIRLKPTQKTDISPEL